MSSICVKGGYIVIVGLGLAPVIARAGEIEAITAATEGMIGLVGTVLTAMLANPITLSMLAVMFVFIGIKLFRGLKHAAK